MNDDIKVGDVCEVLRGGYYFPAGTEVTVISGPRMYPFVPPTEESFEITDASGVRCWAYRSTLRKKRPPADVDEQLRELGDDTPNKRTSWSDVPGFVPPKRVKELA